MSSMYAMPAASWEAFVLDGELGDSSFLQCLLEDADDVLVGCNTQVPAPAEQTCNTVKSKPRKRGYLAADERMSRVREQNRCEAVTCCLSLLYDSTQVVRTEMQVLCQTRRNKRKHMYFAGWLKRNTGIS